MGLLFSHKKEWNTYTCYNIINFENITLSENRQTQEVTHHMIPFIQNIQNRKITETESRLLAAGAGRREATGINFLMVKDFYFWVMRLF